MGIVGLQGGLETEDWGLVLHARPRGARGECVHSGATLALSRAISWRSASLVAEMEERKGEIWFEKFLTCFILPPGNDESDPFPTNSATCESTADNTWWSVSAPGGSLLHLMSQWLSRRGE